MEAIMIYKISPDPSLPKRGEKRGYFPKKGGEEGIFLKRANRGKILTNMYIE
jgi:hypothetical protein